MNTQLRVRRATVADAPAIAYLLDAVDPPTLVARMRSLPEGHAVLVAERGAGVVGFIHVAVDPSLSGDDRAQVAGLAVAAEDRRSGVGALLVDEAAAWAREHGCHGLWLGSSGRHEAAHRFYRATGFTAVDDHVEFRRPIAGAVDATTGPSRGAVTPVVVRTTPSI
ncbi:GNAT family N-acetyltransferase [Nitriliruptor alkaliphilus]|uniref:GNAT family N-acetyltransferase n=1 Tax=Nitriliruptor alkaliphilus TaxID=427918 RepID=UPI000698035A|nr:GNAT family N-acetyltransferase [Nitriliruptor alkaliphilus]